MAAVARALLAAVALGAALVSCAEGRVVLDVAPRPGATYHYEVTVRSTTVTEIAGAAPTEVDDEVTLVVEQEVLSVSSAGSRVRLTLRGGGVDQNLLARFDRAAQLVGVERIEEFDPDLLGDVGLSAVFPAAVSAPPRRPLAPGDRWAIDQTVDLPGGTSTRIRGRGRLAELGVVSGREVAAVATRVEVPVDRSVRESGGVVELRGRQVTSATTARSLRDGAVETATSRTVGRYTLTLVPDTGAAVTSIPGRLRVEVDTTTRRVD